MDKKDLINAGKVKSVFTTSNDDEVIIAKIIVNENGQEEYIEPTDEEFEKVQEAYEKYLDELAVLNNNEEYLLAIKISNDLLKDYKIFIKEKHFL